MRKLNNTQIYPDVRRTDVQEVTSLFFQEPIDMETLIKEAHVAEEMHIFQNKNGDKCNGYTDKAFIGWTSLPLRSLGGIVGEDASDAVGDHASSDADKFADTPAMQPYIKKLIAQVGGRPLKVRLMKMRAFSSVGEHRDNFNGNGVVVRFHIPIVTHPKVIVKVNGKPYHFEAGKLYRIDVSQRHAVINNSHIDRIHLVFDVCTTGTESGETITKKLSFV